jgi:hypothetical protein
VVGWRRITVLTAALALAGAAARAQPAATVVQDPHYGAVLFDFFQDEHFAAITGLMASQHFDRVSRHADEAEVLRGGMLLSYGLHREAGAIFAQLIERGATPAVRDRAWFYLAKMRYQRGLVDDAFAALERIGPALPRELAEERALLQAQLLIAREDYAGAVAILQTVPATSAAAPYARFNLGVALVRGGDAARGRALLDELGRASAVGDEAWSLRDKANVALGFAALQEQQYPLARGALERVRLNGLQSNKALLGFGWADAALKAPARALVPWTELAGRDASDAAVLEARIAVPYAYAELGAHGQALQRYEDALAAFEREGRALDESIAAARAGTLVAALLPPQPVGRMGLTRALDTVPAIPHAGHLTPLLASHAFQQSLGNLRDLRFLGDNLQAWSDKLSVFDDMLATRRAAYAERLPQALARSRELTLQPLQSQRDQLAAELARADEQADGTAFASPRQRELAAMLERVSDALKSVADDPAFDAGRHRARLAQGALIWQLAQDEPARVWEAKKALLALNDGLAQAREREAALARAQRDEPARFDAFAARLTALAGRIRGLQPVVAALAGEQQGELQDLAVAELQRQQERLAVYADQARFAIAQLIDRAQLARKDDADAPRP